MRRKSIGTLTRAHERVCMFGRGDDTIGNPHRTLIYQFEFFELILLLKLDKQFPVEQFEATASQSTAPSPLLSGAYLLDAEVIFEQLSLLYALPRMRARTPVST